MTKYLVLDTNVFVQDFRMEGNSFRPFLQNYKAVTDKIIIPKIVFQETLNQFSKRLDEEIDSLNKNRKNLARLIKDFQFPEIKTSVELTAAYKQHFELMLSVTNYEILDYPKVTHEKIAQKAIKRVKPFKGSGEGYCDALIWETILGILNDDENNEVIFVTQNKKDFLDGDVLSKDLLSELNASGIAESRISVWLTLKDVVDSLLLQHLEVLKELKEQINTNSVPGIDLFDWISNRLFDILDPEDAGFVVSGVDSDECSIHLSEIFQIYSVVASDVRLISGGDKYILMSTRIGLGVDICADSQQYLESPFIASIFDNQSSGMPTPYECIYESSDVDVTLSIVIRDNDFANCNVEILTLSGAGGSVNFKPGNNK